MVSAEGSGPQALSLNPSPQGGGVICFKRCIIMVSAEGSGPPGCHSLGEGFLGRGLRGDPLLFGTVQKRW